MQPKDGAIASESVIFAAKYNPLDAQKAQCPSAHDAGLAGYEKLASACIKPFWDAAQRADFPALSLSLDWKKTLPVPHPLILLLRSSAFLQSRHMLSKAIISACFVPYS